MKFGDTKIEDAAGCILAHSVQLNGAVLKKGTRLDAETIGRLKAARVGSVLAARLEDGDVQEDEAAAQIAAAIAGAHVTVAKPFTGRANIFAGQDGVFVAGAERIISLNSVDEAITVATLAPLSRVAGGQMLATVKIIPFSVAAEKLSEFGSIAKADSPVISVAPFRPLRVGLIISRLPGDREKVIEKRRRVVDERVASLGGSLEDVSHCAHSYDAVTAAMGEMLGRGYDLLLAFGATAIVDRADVIPMALERAGGRIVHLGLPVDPGNLLLYGKISGISMIGVPSCASSIKINGFDWALERVFAGLPLGRREFSAMAPGGLLKEIASRPQPRERAGPK